MRNHDIWNALDCEGPFGGEVMTIVPEHAATSREVSQLLTRAAQLGAVEHTERADAGDTWARLNKHGLDDAEIERQLASLKWNSAENKTAAITTYSYLHGLQHLDALARQSGPMNASA